MPIFDLDVRFEEKGFARKYGADWDPERRTWFYKGEKIPRQLAIFYNGPRENIEQINQNNTNNKTNSDKTFNQGTNMNNNTSMNNSSDKTSASQEISAQTTTQTINGRELSQYLTVSKFQERVAGVINTATFMNVAIRGEVADFKEPDSNGNYWFKLKDKENGKLLPVVIWASNVHIISDLEKMKEKPEVAVIGSLKWYEKNGNATFQIFRMTNIGDGVSNLELLALTKKLEDEGIFDIAHHKKDDEFPKYPRGIGVITAKTGKAIKDICVNAQQYTNIYLYQAQVQSVSNVDMIVDNMINGIKMLDGMKEVEVIIIGRGGDSPETLMRVYNNEKLIRAVYSCKTPVVSSVGHEGDDPLLDRVADKAFNAPSTAAIYVVQHLKRQVETLNNYRNNFNLLMRNKIAKNRLIISEELSELNLYSPEKQIIEKKSKVDGYIQFFGSALQKQINDYHRRLDGYKNSIINAPQGIFLKNKNRLELQRQSLRTYANKVYDERRKQFELAVRDLNGLSPTAKLINGFGYISVNDSPLNSVKDVRVGDEIQVTIHDGVLSADIKDIKQEDTKHNK